VLTPEISVFWRGRPGRNNEIQITDGLRELCLKTAWWLWIRGRRYDTGNPNDYVETFAILPCAIQCRANACAA
jgi:UTP-glucose-1-phosphate uridylyltransferase